ncbi:energy-coupling factor transporter ATPase [Thermoactinomyces mirandus]|uniref:Energy-coupling factor transporter ATPase n=1 Tax=Thermoactinomyces mirandus TaxID=2756294 RepID=A0A7W2ARP2_9BACL|nr:energy-coupling factor transporter ATPase [Thermoactinomyces mirandus]MBA4603199.1 energy-coupling factor transporter ATPase [Thermoactinomyces mirandus]
MEPIIQFEHVWFRYQVDEPDPPWVLKDIRLNIDPGEYVSIVGNNGSGKSTLARLANGLLLPTKGRVMISGMETSSEQDIWQIRRTVGMVFQNPENQIVATSVEDDIAFGLENIGVPPLQMEEKIKNAVKAVGLEGFEHHEPHTLSGGQKQRLAIAGVIVLEPDVIIFDESTSMLDPVGRKTILEIMQSLNRRGKTIIHITHSAEEAFMADRMIVMHQGECKLDEATGRLYQEAMRLKEWELDVPLEIELWDRLRQKGWPLPDKIINKEELVSEIWRLLSRT